jgi:hypothetical protein
MVYWYSVGTWEMLALCGCKVVVDGKADFFDNLSLREIGNQHDVLKTSEDNLRRPL